MVEVSEEAAALLNELKAELDEAVEARKRALADFANYQRRASENESSAVRRGAADVVKSLLGALDHFDLALGQDREQMTVDQLLGGVQIVRDELTKALARHGVQRLDPEMGDVFDPNRHAAVLRQTAEGVPANHIVAVLQSGYLMGDLVLRPARLRSARADLRVGAGPHL